MDPLKASPPQDTKLHFLDYWRIIRIRKTVILAVFLLVVLTATIVTFVLPPMFASKARIKVERDTTDVPGTDGRGGMSVGYDPFFIQTEFEVIQSERILDKVVDDLKLGERWAAKMNSTVRIKTADCRRNLKGMLELRPERNTSIIDITVYDDDKDEAALIANEIAKVYEDYRQGEKTKLISRGIEAYKAEMEIQRQKLTNQEATVDDLRQKLDVTDTDPQAIQPGMNLESMDVMHYNSIKVEKETLYISKEALLNKLKSLAPEVLRQTLPTTIPDAILTSLLQDYIASQTHLVTLLNDYGPDHPEVKRAQAQVADLDTHINDRVNGIIEGLEADVAAAKAIVANSVEKVNEARTNDLAKVERTRPYYSARAELERLKRFYDVLSMRAAQERVEERIPKSTMVERIDSAEPNPVPVRPKRALNIMLGIIIGLVVGVGLAFFIEYLDTSVKTIDDVERTLQAPVLGVIPQNVGYLLEEGAESPHAEAYRVLRTNLLFSRKDDKLNTVAVVSAGAGEGKSTTVCNLATVFAQCGQRVLMVDSDLRRPTLHKLLGVTNSIGLTNYLLKQNPLEEVIQTSSIAGLDFMASGKLPSSSLGILSSAQMKDLIGELKQRYDFVFFDSPPIMGVSDASILASEVDMTLQVIQYRRYPQPMNIRAKQLIEKVGGNLIGIVLNNINMSQDESYYYYSGYYHDYYSKNDDDSDSPGGGKGRTDVKSKI